MDRAAAQHFDAFYYQHGCGRPYQRDETWLAFFGQVAQRIVDDIRPASVLDAGCAMGFLVETLREREVEAYGVDISEYAIAQVYEPIRPFCRVGSLVEPLPRRYDLIVSIEVLEHMGAAEAERAVAQMCAATDDVLFSSSPLDYKESTHFNVRPPEAWAELFARHGFFRDADFDGSFLTPWATRFRRMEEPTHRLVRGYERRFWQLWQENVELRQLSLEQRHELATTAAAQDEARRLRAHLAAVERGRVMRWMNGARRLAGRAQALAQRLAAGRSRQHKE